MIKYILNGKATITLSVAGFPKPTLLGRNVKVALDLSNYATKPNLKNATGADTLNFARKSDLASLKLGVAKLDIG